MISPTAFLKIDKELRLAGLIASLFLRPSRLGFRWTHRQMQKNIAREMNGATAKTVWIERSDRSGAVRTLIFKPEQPASPTPTVVYLHGGGYAMGLPDQADAVGRMERLMGVRPSVFVAPDYRLSIDHPYPAGLDDCYATLLWVKDNIAALGGRSDQIFVMGDSAGGGLCAACCLLARDRGDVNIAFQMPLYPMLDDRQATPSAVNNTMPVWNSKHNKVGWGLYLGDLAANGAPIPSYAAPARANDLANLPPAATFAGELDPFLDETTEYVEKLRATGIPVQFKTFPGCYHAFEKLVPQAAVSRRARQFIHKAFAFAVDHYFAEQPQKGVVVK